MRAIPLYGGPQTIGKGNLGSPAQLALDLRAIDGIAAVMAGSVLDVADQRGGLAQRVEQQVSQLEVGLLAATADVVDLTRPALLQHSPDRRAMITHV